LSKSTLHKILSTVIVTLLLLPIGLSFVHTFEHHKHRVCNSKDIQHIHTVQLDCSIYHYNLRVETVKLEYSYALLSPISHSETPLFLAKECESKPQKKVTVRGPPPFII